MARTQNEVRAWLNAQNGRQVADKSNAALNGQCVALIKGLMEFLGVGNPYGARGNAKDAGNSYINQGIGRPGRGWLTICVNPSMGGGYGHIWVDVQNEFNIEQNGGRALYVTKNTRPVQQAAQFVNFDQWLIPESQGGSNVPVKTTKDTARILLHGIVGRNSLSGRSNALDGSSDADAAVHHIGVDLTNEYIQGLFLSEQGRQWRDSNEPNSIGGINHRLGNWDIAERDNWQGQIGDRTAERDAAIAARDTALKTLNSTVEAQKVLVAENQKLQEQLANQSDDTKLLNGFGEFLNKLIARLGVKKEK